MAKALLTSSLEVFAGLIPVGLLSASRTACKAVSPLQPLPEVLKTKVGPEAVPGTQTLPLSCPPPNLGWTWSSLSASQTDRSAPTLLGSKEGQDWGAAFTALFLGHCVGERAGIAI